MRSFVALCAAAALWSAGRAEASRPFCLEWGMGVNDGGYDAGHTPDAILSVPGIPDAVEPPATDGEGVLVETPPGMRRVCKRMGYRDEGGCAVAGGAPAGLIALAVLGVALRRARRRTAGTCR